MNNEELEMLVGNKVVLFRTNEADIDSIQDVFKSIGADEMPEDLLRVLLFQSNKLCFTAVRKFGKDVKKLGFVLLGNKNPHTVSIQTLFTPYMLKGLSKKLKQGDITYTQDIIVTMIEYCVDNLKKHRVETTLSVKDKNELAVYKKCGFKKEGTIRDCFLKKDIYTNGVLLSYIEER